jgi:NADH-quinone oxidoreductase subunit N
VALNIGLAAPEFALLGTAIAVIVLDLFITRKRWLVYVCLAGLGAAAALTIAMWGDHPRLIFNNMLAVDNYALFFKLLFLGIAALIILASTDYVSKFKRFQGEYYALVLLATLGMILMAATTDLISIYLALELTAISFYVLVGFLKDRKSTEASLKYLLLGGVASAILLYGLALVFGFTGTTQLSEIAQFIQAMPAQSITDSPGLILGIILLVAGFGFKVAAVPFQFWVPDVYEGAPTPITLFLSVGSKAAGFAILLRVFYAAFSQPSALAEQWGIILAVLAAVGMTVGNVVAIWQTNIKRMLGYSSIAHAGYLLIGLAAVGMAQSGDTVGQSSILFYLLAFAVTDIAAFVAVIAITNKIGSDDISRFSGLGKQAPVLALALTLALLSLTGFPPTAGFLAKFYIFSAGVNNGLTWLVVIALLNTVISAYFYLRVVKLMWLGKPTTEGTVPSSWSLRFSLASSSFLVLLLGIFPAFALNMADLAARMFIF